MKKLRWPILLTLACLVAMLLTLTVSATPENGWNKEGDFWFYYRDGNPVYDEVLEIGGVRYGFCGDGRMLDNYDYDWIDGSVYRALPGGRLMSNQWYESEGWRYYYGSDGKGYEDFCTVDGVEYYFSGDGSVCCDTAVYSAVKDGIYAISKDGLQSKHLNQEGWNQAFGEWYYIVDGNYLDHEILVLGQNRFWFHGNGQMAKDTIDYFYDEEGYEYYGYFDANGYLKTGWFKLGNDWAYADADGQICIDGIYEIGGELYFFTDHKMRGIPGEYRDCYITASGALMRNKWYWDTTNDQRPGWVYFGEDGQRVYGLYQIGDISYYFDWCGLMVTNGLAQTDEGVYVFDQNGKGTQVDGWFDDPYSDGQKYAKDGKLAEGVVSIGGVDYGFDYDGLLAKDQVIWSYDSETEENLGYLCDLEGRIIQKTGWHKSGGCWYYVEDTNGLLAYGFRVIGGVRYYFYPEMATNIIMEDLETGILYAVNSKGICTPITGTGLQTYYGELYYLENGKMVRDAWRNIGGKWYYFGEYGGAAQDGMYTIKDVCYLFNEEGVMLQNAWYDRHYADQNGVMVTGIVTIDGKQYLFDEGGYSERSGMHTYEGVSYLVAPDGVILGKAAKQGWNQIGSDWYYVTKDGELLTHCLHRIGGITYGFDGDGKMCTNGIRYAWYDFYMFDANGKVLTGWQKIDGKWYYAFDDSDPVISESTVETINGKEYVFKYNYVEIGTFVFGNKIYTTDASGAVISKTPLPDGWTYSDGDVLYSKNGAPYTGWVGDYYVENGYMLYNQRIQYGDKYYYLGADGRYVKNGLFRDCYDAVVAVKADGTLYCYSWYKHGNDWYYFGDGYAYRDCEMFIDGAVHRFDNDGIWLGEVEYEDEPEYPKMSDGWQKIGSKWYYYMDGQRLFGERYIGGVLYYFGFKDGAMQTNCFSPWSDQYYGADGKVATYTGWKMIDGEWVYFDATHSAARGFIPSGSGWYYTRYQYNTETDEWSDCPVMVKNEAVVSNGRLYIFGANGYCAGYVTNTGWHLVAQDWYYVENGYVVDDYKVVNGAGYLFDDGRMVLDTYVDIEINGRYVCYYFGKDGKRVTKDGWHQNDYGWIYIRNGEMLTDGIYQIGGKNYTFSNGLWVQ